MVSLDTTDGISTQSFSLATIHLITSIPIQKQQQNLPMAINRPMMALSLMTEDPHKSIKDKMMTVNKRKTANKRLHKQQIILCLLQLELVEESLFSS